MAWKASKENHLLLKAVFEKREEELSEAMLSLGANLANGAFANILHIIVEVTRSSKTAEHDSPFNVEDMDDAGRAKVRYVTGWMASRIMKKSRKYIIDNLYLPMPSTRERVNKEVGKLKMLGTHVAVPYHVLSSSIE